MQTAIREAYPADFGLFKGLPPSIDVFRIPNDNAAAKNVLSCGFSLLVVNRSKNLKF